MSLTLQFPPDTSSTSDPDLMIENKSMLAQPLSRRSYPKKGNQYIAEAGVHTHMPTTWKHFRKPFQLGEELIAMEAGMA